MNAPPYWWVDSEQRDFQLVDGRDCLLRGHEITFCTRPNRSADIPATAMDRQTPGSVVQLNVSGVLQLHHIQEPVNGRETGVVDESN